MPKRKRLYTTPKKKLSSKPESPAVSSPPPPERDVRVARGRLMGALLEALEGDDSDHSSTDQQQRRSGRKKPEDIEEAVRQSYVLKLFDRSVDLSQFTEDTPLYPICRAWIANQPKLIYSQFGSDKYPELEHTDKSVELPGPKGPLVSRVPPLLPQQKTISKDNISFDYRENPPPSREYLISTLVDHWSAVRKNWAQQSAKVEARYADTQRVLNEITKGTLGD